MKNIVIIKIKFLADTDCKKRWCYVRDYYIRRKGKPGTGTSGEAAKKRSDHLSFLDSIPYTQRNSITNIIENPEENTQHSSEQNSKPFQNQETEDMTFSKEEDIGTDTYYNNDNSKGNSNNVEDIIKKFKEDGNIKSKMKRKNKERLNLLKQIVNRKPSPQNELDETDLFFSSMAKIVKKLPRYEQAQLRMQIGSLVGNAELRYISIDSAPINSPMPSTSGSKYSERSIRSSELNTE